MTRAAWLEGIITGWINNLWRDSDAQQEPFEIEEFREALENILRRMDFVVEDEVEKLLESIFNKN